MTARSRSAGFKSAGTRGRNRARAAGVIALVIAAVLTASFLTGGFKGLSIISPSAPIIFNPVATIVTSPCGACLAPASTRVTDQSVVTTDPVGNTASMTFCCTYSSTWQAWGPNYQITAGLSGSGFTLLNASSRDGQQMPTLPVAPYTPTASHTLTPGAYCVPGTTAGSICNPYMIVQNFTSTVPYNSTTNKVTSTESVWYVGRYLTAMTLSSPGIMNAICLQGSSSVFGFTKTGCDPSIYCPPGFLPGSIDYGTCNAGLVRILSGILPGLDATTLVTGATYSIQINVPLTWANTNLDWYGVYGAWLGLNANSQTLGSCNGSTCNTGLGDHAVIGIYKDSAASIGAFPVFSQYYTTLSTMTASQIAGLVSSNLLSTVYAKIPVQSFGTTFQLTTGGSCTVNTPNACFTPSSSAGGSAGTGPAFMSIPIIFDTIGTKSTFQTSYVSVSSGLVGNYVSGKVLDGNSVLCGVSACGPLGGVTVTDGTSLATSGGDGTWSLSNLPVGTSIVSFSFANYVTAYQTINCPQSGNCTPTGFTVVLQPTTATGTTCLIGPIYSSVPGQPPLFGGICPPTWLLVTVIGAIVGLIGFTIFLVAPSRRKASLKVGKFGAGI